MSVEWRKIGYEVRLTFGFVKRMGRQCVKFSRPTNSALFPFPEKIERDRA